MLKISRQSSCQKKLRTGLTALIGGAKGRALADQIRLATSGAVHIGLLAAAKASAPRCAASGFPLPSRVRITDFPDPLFNPQLRAHDG